MTSEVWALVAQLCLAVPGQTWDDGSPYVICGNDIADYGMTLSDCSQAAASKPADPDFPERLWVCMSYPEGANPRAVIRSREGRRR